VEAIGDELLVFDTERTIGHSLNPLATSVWRACDGSRSAEEIAAHCGLSDEVVSLSLAELAGTNLLEPSPTEPEPDGADRLSRRHVLRRAALTGVGAGLALPVIRSVVAPSSALAVSSTCAGQFDTCASASACCPSQSKCHTRGSGATGFCSFQACHGSGSPCTVNQDCCFPLHCSSFAGSCG
jgi:hypothetical protein